MRCVLEQSRCPTYLILVQIQDAAPNAGVLLGEDLAFQANEAGSNPTTRSSFLLSPYS